MRKNQESPENQTRSKKKRNRWQNIQLKDKRPTDLTLQPGIATRIRGDPDPNSTRRENINKKEKGGKGDTGRRNKGDGKDPTADSQPTADAPRPTVGGIPSARSMNNKISSWAERILDN